MEGIQLLKDAHAVYAELAVKDHLTMLGLSTALSSLYDIKPSETSINESISYGSLALESCGPAHRDLYRAVRALSHVQIGRAWFFSTNGPEYLGDVIDTLRATQAHAPLCWRKVLVDELSMALSLRFAKRDNQEDVSESITRVNAVLSNNQGRTDLHCAQLHARLSVSLQLRFNMTGMPEDIEAASRAAEVAMSNAIAGKPLYLNWLVAFASCRGNQYYALGDIAHLNQAIALFEEIMQSAPVESTAWEAASKNLLDDLLCHYQTTGDVKSLHRAVELVPVALAGRGKRDLQAPKRLHNAGRVFLAYFDTTGTLENLDQATAFLRDSVKVCSNQHYEFHKYVGTYAKALRIRYETLHEEESAAKALQLHGQTIQSLPETHWDRTLALTLWA
jgi:tetratricopeptide (TPR) repeat protein